MTIRDRGKMKWQGAFFMHEHVKMLNDFNVDYYRHKKQVLDVDELEDIENKIHEAMEFTQVIIYNLGRWL
ncbi:YolD-like family protein [Bacillus sp. 31A1R]|uniref:YolD-like family protein n=1 Tax=Robertmurraya mangrovi TaxID=3098077 RepID=A0ABU5ITF2_9BACI|nr:YolD-like family protein [Bacillus sp. 31A1R]MDZ5470415.1 YolD-like family protein [Bacillus sp. 31A1R]